MTTDALLHAPSPRRAFPDALARRMAAAHREGPILLTVAFMAAGLVFLAPLSQLTQDAWLTLVSGREIFQHGLHAPDSLAILTRRQEWVDQQWLAQLGFYGLATAGGIKLVMLVHFALLAGSYGLALVVARLRGARPLAAAWVGALALPLSIWSWPTRSQNFAYPLFVAVLALLVLDRGAVSRRVFWVLPLLALWANLHGSVLFGAALVVLYAAACAGAALRRRERRAVLVRCGALAAGATAATIASPYGLSLAGYYRSIVANDDIKLLKEWRPAWEYAESSVFYLVLAVAIYLVARHRHRLHPFETLVLLATAASGFQAVRNIVWFGLAALVILPVALDGTRPFARCAEAGRRSPRVAFAPLAVAILAVTAVAAASRSDHWYEQRWPPRALATVSAELRSDPATTVWATERFADWLVWKDRALAGHIAYDARFEMLGHRHFRRVAMFKTAKGRNWPAVVRGYDLVVLSSAHDRRQIAALTKGMHRARLYADDVVTVLGRAPSA